MSYWVPVTFHEVTLPGGPAAEHVVRQVTDRHLLSLQDPRGAVQVLQSSLTVVVVVAVWDTAVVGPAHPGEHRGLAAADDHCVGPEDSKDLIVVVVTVGQAHDNLPLILLHAGELSADVLTGPGAEVPVHHGDPEDGGLRDEESAG